MSLRRAVTITIATGFGLWLAGCGGAEPTGKAPDLALACQTMDCVCSEKEVGIFETRQRTDVLWRANGDAYCPDAFALVPAGG